MEKIKNENNKFDWVKEKLHKEIDIVNKYKIISKPHIVENMHQLWAIERKFFIFIKETEIGNIQLDEINNEIKLIIFKPIKVNLTKQQIIDLITK
jgi:hypothetical protein